MTTSDKFITVAFMFNFTELIGYGASFFVALSLLMSSFIALRVLNLIGAIAFVTYGILIGSIPILITNGFIMGINVWFLLRMTRKDLNGVRYIPVHQDRHGQLNDFIEDVEEDLRTFFPDFSLDRLHTTFATGGKVYAAMKGLVPIGISLVHPVPPPGTETQRDLEELYHRIRSSLGEDEVLLIPVDYVTKKYRGLGLVDQLYEAIVAQEGCYSGILAVPVAKGARRHERFLRRHGFTQAIATDSYTLYSRSVECAEPLKG